MPENRRKAGNTGSFQPGESGNPGGRPKLTPEGKEVRDLLRQHSLRAVDCLLKLLDGGGPLGLRAAEVILDRAWGAPGQEKDVRHIDGVRDMRERFK